MKKKLKILPEMYAKEILEGRLTLKELQTTLYFHRCSQPTYAEVLSIINQHKNEKIQD
jgi:hypothetical protein